MPYAGSLDTAQRGGPQLIPPLVPPPANPLSVMSVPSILVRRRVFFWRQPSQWTNSVAGIIDGVVYEGPAPSTLVVQGCEVRLMHRQSNFYLASTQTDRAGYFRFIELDPTDLEGYYAAAFDPDSGVRYNAVIFDRLTARVA